MPNNNKWNDLVQQLENTKTRVHCHIPVCVGHAECVSEADLIALAEIATMRGFRFTFYTHPKDDESLVRWRESTQILHHRYPGQIVDLDSSYRQRPQWRELQTRYLEFLNGNKKPILDELLRQEVEKYKIRQSIPVDLSDPVRDQAIKDHLINCAVDIASWMVRSDDPLIRKNIVIYPGRMTVLMHNIMDKKMGNAACLGLKPGSLTHFRNDVVLADAKYAEKTKKASTTSRVLSVMPPRQPASVTQEAITIEDCQVAVHAIYIAMLREALKSKSHDVTLALIDAVRSMETVRAVMSGESGKAVVKKSSAPSVSSPNENIHRPQSAPIIGQETTQEVAFRR